MSTLLTESQKQTLHGYAWWVKFLTVLGYIYAGFLILIGIITLIVIVGIFYLALGGLMIWLLGKIRKSAAIVEEVETDAAVTTETGFTKLVEAFENLRIVAKVYGIIAIVSLVMTVLGALLFGGAIWAAISSGEFELESTDPETSLETEQSFQELLDEIDAEIEAAEQESNQ